MSPATGSWPAGAAERKLAGQWRGLLHMVVVAEAEGQRELDGEIACRGVVVQSCGEFGVAKGDPTRRGLRGVGVRLARCRVGDGGSRPRLGTVLALLAGLVCAATGRHGHGGKQCDAERVATECRA